MVTLHFGRYVFDFRWNTYYLIGLKTRNLDGAFTDHNSRCPSTETMIQMLARYLD